MPRIDPGAKFDKMSQNDTFRDIFLFTVSFLAATVASPWSQPRVMIFNVNEEEYLEMPDAESVRFRLSELDFEEFAILEKGDQQYIQAYHHEDDSWQLEYRAGSADQHFAATNHSGLPDVQAAFVSYLAQVEDWPSKWTWEKVDFEADDFEMLDE